MKKQFLTIAFLLVLGWQAAFAQYEDAKDGMGVRGIFLNYQFPITNEWRNDQFTTGAEVEYVRHLNKALNLAIPLRLAKAEFPTDRNGGINDSPLIGLDATLQLKFFRENAFIYPYLYGGIGAINERFEEFSFSAPAGLGLNFRIAKHTYLSLKGEYRFGFDDLRDNIQLGAGLLIFIGEGTTLPPAPKDTDGDGVPDDQDDCPLVPGLPQFRGCPDTDGDGIPDREDECPNEPGPAATKGCPDRDGDGIPDKDDLCPDEPGTVATQGCPDRDGDGIPDKDDLCPGEPGPAATRGCPDRDGDGIPDKDDLCPDQPGPIAIKGCPDRDGDGVPDKDDRCPDTPGPASNFGCPEVQQEDKETLDLAMSAVQFETAKSTLLPASFEVLNQIVTIMNRYPDYKMRISGHTDSIGSAASNQTLSENRAKACYDYLIVRGIKPDRLSYVGYGQTRPIADNRYKAGRDKNRRVEFELYIEE
ncbi:MAG TPA: OmpA family protein [Saprospiraceae bacterium]|nr:OmpA family protein [Saprospiraceae bacterium]HMP25536.1 OmpA family protein [Saprospiraceae bacterium]